MTGINFITGFLKNKIYAIYLGLSGLGVISQFTSSISFLTYLLPLGFPVGITQLIAQSKDKDKSFRTEIIYTAFIILLMPVLLTFFTVFFFSSNISIFLFNEVTYSGYIKILSIVIPFLVFFSVIEAILKGLGNISLYVKSLVLSSVVSFIVSIPLVIIAGIRGAAIGLTVNYIFFVLYSLYKFRKSGLGEFKPANLKFNKKILKQILKIGTAFLVAGAMYQLSLVIMKRMVIEKYGLDGSGLFQSIFNISLFYFGFIFTSMSSYTFPKIAGLFNNTDLTSELNTTIRFISLVMVPLILILVVFRNIIILILYTPEFLIAEPFFQFQFLGDFFKALSWVLGIWLIPRSKIFFFLLFDILLNLNLIFIFKYLLDYTEFGIKGASFAYMAAYIIHFLFNLILSRKTIGFRFTKKNLNLIFSSLTIIIILTFLSFQNFTYGYVLFLPVFLGWLFLNLSMDEIRGMKKVLKNFLKSRINIKDNTQ